MCTESFMITVTCRVDNVEQFSRARIEFYFWHGVPRRAAGSAIGRNKVRLQRCIAGSQMQLQGPRSRLALDTGLGKRKPSADHQSPGMAKREIVALLYLEHGDASSTDWVEEDSEQKRLFQKWKGPCPK